MKTIVQILALAASLLVFFGVQAQIPQSFNYQAIARNADGSAMANTTVAIRVNINTLISGGTTLYSERHDITTNPQGLFTVQIGSGIVLGGNFASINWTSGAKFVETALDINGATGGYSFVLMGSSQLVSVPFALAAQQVLSAPTLDQAYNAGGSGAGRVITANAGAVEVTGNSNASVNIRSTHSGNGVALIAENTNVGGTFASIQATTNSGSNLASAIVGSSSGMAYALSGQLEATGTAQSAVYGNNLRTSGGHGLMGHGFNGTIGETNYSSGFGIYGENYDAIAPLGNGVGVAGIGYYGVLGQDRYLGGQAGAYGVFSNGNFVATGTKSFMIDHPLDPENRFLKHFTLESNEVLNVYRGNVVFGPEGEAVVSLPEYFSSINQNFSYQLTPVGAAMNLYIKEKISGNTFVIAGGLEGKEASWAVFAERSDAFLTEYPIHREAEPEKRAHEKGKYLMPALFDQPADKGIFYLQKPETLEQIRLNVLNSKD
ncbi:MAG: hypothetical protein IPM47_14970 [Sphingobacteriales bacterium]|nr:MAG: hypothetical protein IPM47_14970 [Sphingobacteriales bacterium]